MKRTNENNIKQLTDDHNKKQQELSHEKRAFEGAAREAKDLQTHIEDLQRVYAELNHRTPIQIQDFKDALAAKESFIGDLTTDKRNQDDVLQKLREANDEVDNKFEQTVKEDKRKDRAIAKLASVVREKIFVDDECILVNNLLQELEDALATAAQDKKNINELRNK